MCNVHHLLGWFLSSDGLSPGRFITASKSHQLGFKATLVLTFFFYLDRVHRRHSLCDQPGSEFPTSDHRPTGAGGRVAVPLAG